MKRLALVLALTFCLAPADASAVGPGAGTVSRRDVGNIGRCRTGAVTVRYKLDSLMGEPTVAGSFKWSGNGKCAVPSSTVIWLELTYGRSKGYVRLAPVTPKANAGYGYNTTGSPNWNRVVCGYRGTRRKGCMGADSAKQMWKKARVTGFQVAW